jgi:hypothetical protein
MLKKNSLGVLQNDVVTFSPPLPQWKQEGIDTFNMGKPSFNHPPAFPDLLLTTHQQPIPKSSSNSPRTKSSGTHPPNSSSTPTPSPAATTPFGNPSTGPVSSPAPESSSSQSYPLKPTPPKPKTMKSQKSKSWPFSETCLVPPTYLNPRTSYTRDGLVRHGRLAVIVIGHRGRVWRCIRI